AHEKEVVVEETVPEKESVAEEERIVESVEEGIVESVDCEAAASEGRSSEASCSRDERTPAHEHTPTGHRAETHAATRHASEMHSTATEPAEMHSTATESPMHAPESAATHSTTAQGHCGWGDGDRCPEKSRGETAKELAFHDSILH